MGKPIESFSILYPGRPEPMRLTEEGQIAAWQFLADRPGRTEEERDSYLAMIEGTGDKMMEMTFIAVVWFIQTGERLPAYPSWW